MNLEIKHIRERGLTAERIVFVVKENCDLGSFLVFLAKQKGTDSFLLNSITHPFWFPDQRVRKDDLVILYTKNGAVSKKTNKDETTSYFFYRGVNDRLFKDDDSLAVLINAEEWTVR